MENHSPLRRTPTGTSEEEDDVALTAVYSAGSSVNSAPRQSQRLNGRTPSAHSLLAANKIADVRKGAHAETTKASPDRSSISMPPPSTKLSVDRRLSSSFISARSVRKSEDLTRGSPASVPEDLASRSPPSSLKSQEGSTIYSGSPTAHVATTALDPTVVTTASASIAPGLPVLSPPAFDPSIPNPSDLVSNVSTQVASPIPPPRSEGALPLAPAGGTSSIPGTDYAFPVRPRVAQPRSLSSSRRLSTAGSSKGESVISEAKTPVGRIGVCALDVKARSRPSRQILTRLQSDGEFEVIVFGDKSILDEGMPVPLPLAIGVANICSRRELAHLVSF